jgi:tRNA (guanine37-N1)-methyltransferase
MKFGLITLFPDVIKALQIGVIERAIKKEIIELKCWNPRDFSDDKNRRVDDSPYGGGPGMVMKVQPLRDAILAAKVEWGEDTPVIYLSPQGKTLKQADFEHFASLKKLILLAGRYEGIDERLIASQVDAEYSIGDYILTGGELPACVIIDAVTRLLPGALGDETSAQQDSFSQGLLEGPHYTQPAEIDGLSVPEVLRRGHHKEISKWRLKQSWGRTYLRRPELINERVLTKEEQALLNEFIEEQVK